jgi:hypothetical protein
VDEINELVVQLEHQRESIDRAIKALKEVEPRTQGRSAPAQSAAQFTPVGASNVPKRKVSAAARRRMAEGQKRRWAAMKGQSDAAATTKRAEPQKRTMSPEARRRIAKAVRARWAALRKAAKAPAAVAKRRGGAKQATAKIPARKKATAKTPARIVKKSAPRGKVNPQAHRGTAAKLPRKAAVTKVVAAGSLESAQAPEAVV